MLSVYVLPWRRSRVSALQFQAVDTQIELLAWRDAQLTEISLQIENAFPALLDHLADQVERAGIYDLVRSTIALTSSAEATIQLWAAEQLDIALVRGEADLDQAILEFPGKVNLDGDVWDQVMQALPALAGVGLIGASVAAIPTVLSFATVSTSVLAFWGTASISWPLFAVGAVGIGALTLTGSQSLMLANDKVRANLCKRLHQEAARQVFAIGMQPGTRCLLSDIQAATIQAGQNRIRGAS